MGLGEPDFLELSDSVGFRGVTVAVSEVFAESLLCLCLATLQ